MLRSRRALIVRRGEIRLTVARLGEALRWGVAVGIRPRKSVLGPARTGTIGCVAVGMYDREVSFDEFRQRVRRHSPATLLPLLASRARDMASPDSWDVPPRLETPWALAAAARASLLYGSDYRSAARPEDVLAICAAYARLDLLRDSSDERVRTFLLRTCYDQLPYQSAVGNDVARSVAMFRDSLPAVSPTTLTPSALEDALGGTVVEFVGTGWLLFASAMSNGGVFADEWIDQPQFADVVRDLPAPRLRDLIGRSFAADIAAQRADGMARRPDCARDPMAESFAYNPLLNRPLVTMEPGRYLIPSPLLLLRRVTTTGIYYAAMDALGSAIGNDLGAVFEHYVGRQLAQVPGVRRMVPEVLYDRRGKRTVDWFVVFDDLVLLVEVKAPRLTESARLGDDAALRNDLDRTIGSAWRQIDRSATLLADLPHELVAAGVPSHLPARGLVVTLEPYHMVTSPFLDELLPPRPQTPTTVASVLDLENMVSVARGGVSLAEQVRRLQDDQGLANWSPTAAEHSAWPGVRGDNPIIDAASRELPWREQIAARKAAAS